MNQNLLEILKKKRKRNLITFRNGRTRIQVAETRAKNPPSATLPQANVALALLTAILHHKYGRFRYVTLKIYVDVVTKME